MNETELLHRIKISYQSILNEKLVGIYIHGSIAFGCFRWDVSDIDFLVVVKEKLNQEEKEALISELLSLDNECPPKGFEMSVICQDACGCFQYPTPFELHFSNAHKEFALQDLTQYCRRMQGTDKDLAAHCVVIRKVGITLCGMKISEVFGEVSKEAYIDSICADIQNARTDIIENPVYIILNLCRVLAFKRDGCVLSKSEGGEWGVTNLPQQYHTLIRAALNAYRFGAFFTTHDGLPEFADYMLGQIF